MNPDRQLLRRIVSSSVSRADLWSDFIDAAGIVRMAEIGVYRGHFAEEILRDCPSIEQYYMLDPWRSLKDWNKPANTDQETFDRYLEETKSRTDFAAEKRVILRGTTTEVIGGIRDESIDFAYIDADHTLRGITIDLQNVYPKIRSGGWIGGDDFCETIWQHETRFEPTLVFPYAVYFSEAIDSPIYGLPHRQFLIHKDSSQSFGFEDLTGRYNNLDLLSQLRPDALLKKTLSEPFGRIRSLIRMKRRQPR